MANGASNGMSAEARDNIGVLAQRIQTVESAITETRSQYYSLNSKMDEQGKTQNDKIDTLFRSLDSRLTGHIDSISRELGKQVEAVNEKVNTGRIPNYAVVLGFLSISIMVFGTVYAFVSTPINKALTDLSLTMTAERQERLTMLQEIRDQMVPRQELSERWRTSERDIDANRDAISDLKDKVPSRDEYEEFKRTYESNRIAGRADIQAQIADMKATQLSISTSIVPRGEHERVWQSFDQKIGDQQRQIDEIKSTFGGTFNLRDIVARILERQDKQDQILLAIQAQQAARDKKGQLEP